VVSHSPLVLNMVDRLIVIDNGAVTMDGPKNKVFEAIAARQRQAAK
jgi:ATP-binding cassette subfamily C protein LapB